MDQGFQETLLHNGGGIGQPSDPPGNSYFNPILQHNGKPEKHSGYCADIFFNAAMEWMDAGGGRKAFFAYIAPNTPHSPLVVGDEWIEPFRKQGLPDGTARVYGMVANIDYNVGKLLDRLRALGIERDTIVWFLSDNGAIDGGQPNGDAARYNAGMRGVKGTPYQGGTRVPSFLRWPGRIRPGSSDRIAAHIDILPTILEACGVPKPAGLRLDGTSVLGLAEGTAKSWPGRMLFTQWHRGDKPEPFRACAVRTQQWKLINGKELYDMEADPGEMHDVSAEHPDILVKLRQGYSRWLEDVSSTRGYGPPRIYLGTPHENPVILTRQDWRVPPETRRPVGWWEVDVRRAGKYDIRVLLEKTAKEAEVRLELGAIAKTARIPQGSEEYLFSWVDLPSGPARLRVIVNSGQEVKGATYVHVGTL
jgi:arylsulfatase A-like enzyme